MSAAVATRPSPGAPGRTGAPPAGVTAAVTARRRGVLGRLGGLRRTSVGRLRLITGLLVGLGILVGLLAGLTGNSVRAGTDDLGGRAQPLFVEAETIYSALADADTTAAQAFLAGGLEPAALTRRYEEDLDRAAASLSAAARRTGEGSATATAVRELTSGVSRYAELVATARADNRQGLPIGASYLAAASRLNRDTLLPTAASLFAMSQSEVDHGFAGARGIAWLLFLGLLLTALITALVWSQLYLSRTTRRTFNVRLIAATGLSVVLAVLVAGVVISQNVHLHRAAYDGSAPMKSIAEARVLALQIRGDEALTLAARGSDTESESKLQAAKLRLEAPGGPLVNPAYADVDPRLGVTMRAAGTEFRRYDELHTRVHEMDTGGDYEGAVKLAVGKDTTDAFENVRAALDEAFTGRKAVFTDEIGQAGRGLGAFTVLGPVLALIICALAVAGVRPRLEEYR